MSVDFVRRLANGRSLNEWRFRSERDERDARETAIVDECSCSVTNISLDVL